MNQQCSSAASSQFYESEVRWNWTWYWRLFIIILSAILNLKEWSSLRFKFFIISTYCFKYHENWNLFPLILVIIIIVEVKVVIVIDIKNAWCIRLWNSAFHKYSNSWMTLYIVTFLCFERWLTAATKLIHFQNIPVKINIEVWNWLCIHPNICVLITG